MLSTRSLVTGLSRFLLVPVLSCLFWVLPVLASGGAGTPVTGLHPLNDTGITGFSNNSQNDLSSEPTTHPRQDARFGRDAQAAAGKLGKTGSGSAGFDFTKIANDGSILSADAVLGSGSTDWACTRDNVTGLIWEVKTTAGLRSQNHTYSWYNSNSASNGGFTGMASGGSCEVNGRCDTEKFAADVNALGLCGASDWRMPSVKELLGIFDFGRVPPLIDADYFPNTTNPYFWSRSPYAGNWLNAWYVLFSSYSTATGHTQRNAGFRVRLVRDSPRAGDVP